MLSKRIGIFLGMGILVIAVAVIAVTPTSDWRKLTLTTTGTAMDSGVALYKLGTEGSDSEIVSGVYFQHLNTSHLSDTTLGDTKLAADTTIRGGSAKKLTGKVSSGVAGYSIRASDSASISISETFTDSTTVSGGTWSSKLSGATGTTTDVSLSVSTRYVFADSEPKGNDSLTDSMVKNGNNWAFLAPVTDTTISIAKIDSSHFSLTDSGRLVIFNSIGQTVGDSLLNVRNGSTETGLVTPRMSLETGVYDLVFIIWDSSTAQFAFKTASLSVGVGGDKKDLNADSTIAISLTSGATKDLKITGCTIVASPNVVRSVQVVDIGGDAGGSGGTTDNFSQFDSNTAGVQVIRLPNSVIDVTPYDANNNKITILSGGDSIRITIRYDFANYSDSRVSVDQIRVLHALHSLEAWEEVAGSVCDSATSTCTAILTSFSHLGLGNIIGHGVSSGGSGGACVIQNALGSTVLAGVMPSIRDARDMMMSSSIGRLLVSGYYSAMGIALLLFGAGALAFTGRRR